jgi:hypothetical protein
MAEGGKGEEAQPGGASEAGSRATLEDVAAHIDEAAARLEEAADRVVWHYRIENAGVDPAEVRVVLVGAGGEGESALVRAIAEYSRDIERDAPVEMDDTYYDEVRRAVGSGAPSVLLGTSTKSLERSLGKLRAGEQGEAPSAPVAVRSAWQRELAASLMFVFSSRWRRRLLEVVVGFAAGLFIAALISQSLWLGLAVGIPLFIALWLGFRFLCKRADVAKGKRPGSKSASEGKGD